MELKRRRDIDGLRALAIVPVVLFHAGVPGLAGGFIGVDVFFVISGFLITSLIFKELKQGAFSLLEFYERRMRRIAPALIVVTMATLVAGWFLLMPHEYSELAQSGVAALVSFANFHFWADSDYFSTAAELKPLLHTWSLSVEEQFYVVFPLFLMLMNRSTRGRLGSAIWFFCLVSLTASSVLALTHPDQAFYAPWSRAFELLTGSILAVAWLPVPRSKAMLDALGVAGVAMILLPVLFYTEEMPFPGLAALVPVAGTALVIHAGAHRQGPVQALLGLPMLTAIGIISYSLYLWHWPVIAYWKIITGSTPRGWEIVAIVALLLPLSALSWAFIEQPFRRRSLLNRRTVFTIVTSTAILLIAGSISIVTANGVRSRLPDDVNAILAIGDEVSRFGKPPCLVFESGGPTPEDIRTGKLCGIGMAEGRVSFLFIGDSHAGAMAEGVDAAAKRHGLRGLFVGHASCPPILDYQRSQGTRYATCKDTNLAAQELVAQMRIPFVLMTSRWARYINGTTFGNDGPFFDPTLPIEVHDLSGDVAPKLEKTVSAYLASGAHPVLIADPPEVGYDIPFAIARSLLHGRSERLEPSTDVVMERQRLSLAVLEGVAGVHGLEVIKPSNVLCDEHTCKVTEGGRLLYRDEDHLSAEGALFISPLFDALFAGIGEKMKTPGE